MTRLSPLLLTLALLPACQSSSSSDAGVVDTDTSWDGGPLTPCDGEPEDGEVCVPGGTYLLGCMSYDEDCKSFESPMVEVTLSPFFIDQLEATNADLLEFLNALPETYAKEPGNVKDPTGELVWVNGQAPICFSDEEQYYWCTDGCTLRSEDAAGGDLAWLGAKLYCEWRGKRLPTEAEWEAAARGQTKWIYPCAWWFEPCSWGKYDCCIEGIAECFHEACKDCCMPFETGLASPCTSPNGVMYMYGNAAEWVLDGHDDGHSWCQGGCTDPPPRAGDKHYLKGGGVGSDAETTRISARYFPITDAGNEFSGVRCVRSPISFDELASGSDRGK